MNKKYLRSLFIFFSIFFFILLSSCLEPTVNTRVIYLGGRGENNTYAYGLECYEYNNFIEIPYISEGSGYKYLNIEWSWNSPEGMYASVQLVNQDGRQASDTLNNWSANEWMQNTVSCFAEASYYDYGYGMYVGCADNANRLQFFIQDYNYQPVYGIVYIRRVWLSDYSGNEWTIFQAKQPYYQQDYSQVDYTDYRNSNYSIMLRNDTDRNIVCFMGTPREETLISGVKAGTTAGLKRNNDLFYTSFDFVLFVVTENDYLNYRNDLKALENKPMTKLYVFYDKASNNNDMVYTITNRLGGKYNLYLNNPTNYNVEIRTNGLYGEPIIYLPAQTLRTIIGIQEDNYTLFPVFRKYDRLTGEIVNYYSKNASGNPVFFDFSLDYYMPEYEIDTKYFVYSDYTIAPCEAQLTIMNNQSNTGIRLYQGANAVASITSTGIKVIDPRMSATYSVNMESYGYKISEERIISGWRIGTESVQFEIPANVFEAGYRYVIIITGTSYDDLHVEFEKDSEGNVRKYAMNFD